VSATAAYAKGRTGYVLAELPMGRPGELEIQARLFRGDFGFEWRTHCGEKLRILHFGEWNREAGPDFKNARIEFEKRGIEEGEREARIIATFLKLVCSWNVLRRLLLNARLRSFLLRRREP
jgi:hypothetical protein